MVDSSIGHDTAKGLSILASFQYHINYSTTVLKFIIPRVFLHFCKNSGREIVAVVLRIVFGNPAKELIIQSDRRRFNRIRSEDIVNHLDCHHTQ